ncbi:hypothetical protein HMPREF9554_02628 [Treponema phagedenis F0421]|nr:hypothetical protein HMPREF9554_02628 [Treponema phagedenis F0421]
MQGINYRIGSTNLIKTSENCRYEVINRFFQHCGYTFLLKLLRL